MLRKLIVLLTFIFVALNVHAEEVPYAKAFAIALDFFGQNADFKCDTDEIVLLWDGRSQDTKQDSSSPAFYVFGQPSKPGFVIVSGDDSLRPVLAWSFDNIFSSEDIPVNLNSWFDEIGNTVAYARENQLAAYVTSADKGEVVLEMKTASWSQGAPYNNYCPMYNGERTITGCVATSMAIVMRYRKWPESGEGTVPAYETPKGIEVEKRELGKYDWDKMPLSISGNSWTSEEKNEVARLMADCGAMIKANYGVSSTSASTFNAFKSMVQYLKYDAGSYLAERSWYSDQEWHDLLKKELEANGPVMYSANNESGGHSFVIDGYTSDDYFHVNWGWGGLDNGYYTMSMMNPKSQDSPYNDGHGMVLNLKPDEGGIEPQSVKFYSTDIDDIVLRGIHVKEIDAETGLPSLVNLGGFWNKGSKDYDGRFRLGMFDREMKLIKTLWAYKLEEPLMMSHYKWFDNIELDIDDVDYGYRLVAQFFNTDTEEWEMVRANREYDGVDCVLLADEYSIEESTRFRYSKSLEFVILTVKDGVEVTCRTMNGDEVEVYSAGAGEYHINAGELPAGRYVLRLKKEEEDVELIFVTGGNDNE